MVEVIHKPSGLIKKLNQTHANRLIERSKKYGKGWEFHVEAPEQVQEKKVATKKSNKKDKHENTESKGSSSASQ